MPNPSLFCTRWKTTPKTPRAWLGSLIYCPRRSLTCQIINDLSRRWSIEIYSQPCRSSRGWRTDSNVRRYGRLSRRRLSRCCNIFVRFLIIWWRVGMLGKVNSMIGELSSKGGREWRGAEWSITYPSLCLSMMAGKTPWIYEHVHMKRRMTRSRDSKLKRADCEISVTRHVVTLNISVTIPSWKLADYFNQLSGLCYERIV